MSTVLQQCCMESGVHMLVSSSSAVTFYGDHHASQQAYSNLQGKLSDVLKENRYSESVVAATASQINRFIKRHRSLKDAVKNFAPRVQCMRAARVDGLWRLIVSASPDGIKAIRDDVYSVPSILEPGRSDLRYRCPICDEGSDALDDEWLVSLSCGCILHAACARLLYSLEEGDPSDSFKSNCLNALHCYALDAAGTKCNKPLAPLDIAQIVQDPVQLHRRVTEELSRFASFPSSGWRMCPVPSETVKCKLLYRTVPNTQGWSTRVCSRCCFEHCASCEGKPHALGMSCKEAVGECAAEDPCAHLDPSRCVFAAVVLFFDAFTFCFI